MNVKGSSGEGSKETKNMFLETGRKGILVIWWQEA